MLDTKQFGAELNKLGFDFFSGVPCSFLKYLINYAINDQEYVMAANEGDAVAIASGAALAGRRGVALMQNSGLTNATSPLTSLNYTFKLPILGFVSWRGHPDTSDEPQHELMGQITNSFLDSMQVKNQVLSDDFETAKEQLKEADQAIKAGETFFFVVKKGTFAEVALEPASERSSVSSDLIDSKAPTNKPTRLEVLEYLSEMRREKEVMIATTGKTGRELYEVNDHHGNLYMVGSMGCVSSLALGLALTKPSQKVVAIDGDGSVLMRMGALSTVAYYQPKNMLHVILDNNVHDSTGGQATISNNIRFPELCAAMGYPKVYAANNLEEFKNYYQKWQSSAELSVIYLKTQPGSKKDLGRPKVTPEQVRERVEAVIQEETGHGR